ncbi:hypothetical protein WA026_002282 [Henosepilachna vigintioctopunctata]|uniref:Uncharacterized protein n=1 Tax=Henosepilachna vigintioctopunctata TaxID=420089 RepID=A0AAW1TZ01_9CUCU
MKIIMTLLFVVTLNDVTATFFTDEESGTTVQKPALDILNPNMFFYLGRGVGFGFNGIYGNDWRNGFGYANPTVEVISQPVVSKVVPQSTINTPLGWKRGSGTYKKDHTYQSGYGSGMGWKRGHSSMLG